nr:MAG TPA: hypothetical protein [Caudoviricetes sp.]
MAGDGSCYDVSKASSRLFFDEPPVGASLAGIFHQIEFDGDTQVTFFGALFQEVIAVFFTRGEAPANVRIYALQPFDLRAVSLPRSEVHAQKFPGLECLGSHICAISGLTTI